MLCIPVWIAVAVSLTASIAAEPAVETEDIADNFNIDDVPDHQHSENNIPGLDKKLPSSDELLKMLDSMSDLSDDEKNDLREQLMKGKLGMEDNIHPAASSNFYYQIGILLSLLSVIAIIFVFIGYKLYNRLIEKEKRRELKRKQKELRKMK